MARPVGSRGSRHREAAAGWSIDGKVAGPEIRVPPSSGTLLLHARRNGEHTDRISNVLQHRLAQVYELSPNCSSDQLPDVRRNAYTAWPRKTLDPCYEVHGMAIDVFGLDNNVAETDSHAQIDTVALWYAGIPHHHGLLNVQSATHSVDGTPEFN
jgi:hypothetical protein